MIASILAALAGFFGFFKTLVGLFKKTPAELMSDEEKAIRDALDKFRDTGRPPQ